ncbi:MAG: hypothetical protein AAGF83_05420 [Cyanobacteria bacterium P01_G01_bin.67]
MKKLILATLLTPFLLSSPAIASELEPELIMSDEELTRVVCHHLEQTPEVKVAVAKAYSETKSIIDEVQKNTLKALVSGDINANSFCRSIEI